MSEWAEMAHIIIDYKWYWYYSAQMEAKVKLLELSVSNLETQNKYLREQLDATERGLKDMSGLLDTEQAARAREARFLRLELWLWRSGTIIGILAAAICGGALAAKN